MSDKPLNIEIRTLQTTTATVAHFKCAVSVDDEDWARDWSSPTLRTYPRTAPWLIKELQRAARLVVARRSWRWKTEPQVRVMSDLESMHITVHGAAVVEYWGDIPPCEDWVAEVGYN